MLDCSLVSALGGPSAEEAVDEPPTIVVKDQRGVGSPYVILAQNSFAGGLLPCDSVDAQNCAAAGQDKEDGDVS